MKTIVLVCVISSVTNALLGSDLLREVPFKTSAQVTWAVANPLPTNMMTYKQVPPNHPENIVSNAMAICSFSLLNKVKSSEKGVLTFQDKPDNFGMTRRLRISPATGWVEYINSRTDLTSIKGVPTFEEANHLALECFQQLGGETNQINAKPRKPAENTVTTVDRKTGRDIETKVCSQMITIRRQIEGIDVAGSFIIVLGNQAKPQSINMTWPNLEPWKNYQIPNSEQIVRLLKSGQAVHADENLNVPDDVPVTVTTAKPYYPVPEDANSQGIIYPWVHLEVIAHSGKANQVLRLNCPLIEASNEQQNDRAAMKK